MKPESKQQRMQWKHKTSPVSKQCCSWPSAHKIMLTEFWDSKDPLCEHYQQVQQIYRITVTKAGYLDTATSYLHTTEKKKYSVILLHDNACLKTAAHTTTVLQIWNSALLDHPARIPVPTSSDYNLFGPFPGGNESFTKSR